MLYMHDTVMPKIFFKSSHPWQLEACRVGLGHATHEPLQFAFMPQIYYGLPLDMSPSFVPHAILRITADEADQWLHT